MLDFSAVFTRQKTLNQIMEGLTPQDLRDLTNEMIDTMLDLVKDCTDHDVTFQPVDPQANDTYAANDAERGIAWTLGHVIVHVTASSEESAFLAAELARGVEFHGRSRYEVPWESVTTIAQVNQRLEESRRMRLASLELWPRQPHLDNTRDLGFLPDPVNAYGQFALGLAHDSSHLGQIGEIVRQAKAARG
ncbi:MAG: DinB family protein [Roseiflexaceae bacterium]